MKKPKIFILFSLGLLVVGAIIWLIMALVNGWDILGWLSSSRAILMYCILGFYLIICAFVLFSDRDSKL